MVDAGRQNTSSEGSTAQTVPSVSPVNVAFASDDRGTVGLAVAVHSLLRHTKRLVNVWIIEESIDFATRSRLEASWSDSPNLTKVTFVGHTDLPIKIPSWWATNSWPLASCYRFQLAEILPPTVHRCVYLDIDVLVGTDIGALYDLDMKGFPIAMVDGYMKIEADRQYIISIGLDPEHYGNPGVMLMDINAWRRENHTTGLINHARSMRPDLWFFDQDMINAYFKDRFLLLDGRWNKRDAAAAPHGIIQHFAGNPKPWQMAPNDSTLAGLVAWHRARGENGFQPTPSSLPRRLKRRIKMRIAWLQRQLRRLGRGSR
jgi:lipopolysaccharide biosynthesis glycosyltransferase